MNFDIIEVVLDKYISTFRLKEEEYDKDILIEHCADALKHIGAARIYSKKVEEIEVQNRIAKLPLDCEHIMSLEPVTQKYFENGPNFITIDVPNGTKLNLVYQAIPMDSRGYPLIPGSVEVSTAVMWYLAYIQSLGGLHRNLNVQYTESQWQWYCGAARAALNVLNINQTQNVYNDFVRLNPLKDQYYKEFSGVGKPNSFDPTKLLYSHRR
tara:strand:- start:552 stop:1184 length:633 start_codon:yes stop_codon:yes gene_type:complete